MLDIDNFLKECNLIFTNTVTVREELINTKGKKANYDNCITLFQLVYSFNKLYTMFKKDLDKLEKLNLGEKIELISTGKADIRNTPFRYAKFYIEKPNFIDKENTTLLINETNGELKAYIENDQRNYEEVNIKNLDLFKKYLDLFEKYEELIDTYNFLKCAKIKGLGCCGLFTTIDNYRSNLLEGLNEFEISFGRTSMFSEDFANIAFNLGPKLSINKEKCKFKISNELIPLTSKGYGKLLKRIYVNNDNLKKH